MPTYDFDPTATATTVDASGGLTAADEASTPVIMAEWNGMQWTVNPNQIKHLGDVSASLELETETNDDKEGSAPTKTMNLKDQEFEFDYLVTGYAGVDVRDEYEAWTELVGQYAPFFLAGRRFGPSNVQLTKVALSEGQINDFGEIFAGKITVSFKEYAPEASKDKETAKTSTSKSGTVALQTAKKTTTSAASVTASAADKAAKKTTNTQLKG